MLGWLLGFPDLRELLNARPDFLAGLALACGFAVVEDIGWCVRHKMHYLIVQEFPLCGGPHGPVA